MSYLTIAILIFAAAIILFAIDLFIPSGGLLVLLAGVCACVAIITGFQHSRFTGFSMLLASLIAIPLGFWAFVEIWPRTPIGKKMIAQPIPADQFNWSDVSTNSDASALIGMLGVTTSEMLPSGRVNVGDKSYEAFSESGPIELGKTVRVVRLDVGRLVVIAVRERQSAPPVSEGSGLDRPASELSIESLDG